MITKHFKRDEFACKCGCGFDAVDIEIVEKLEEIREYYSTPIIITSGCRCSRYNDYIGGVSQSKHLKGIAADFTVMGVDPKDVQKYLKDWNGGLGSYKNFTHIDAGDKRRWQQQ